jgi:hypothetical protein
MTKAELIKALEQFDDNQEVMILNRFYDGYEEIEAPNKLGIGPKLHIITEADQYYSLSCGNMVGQTVIVLGREKT